MLQKDPTPTIGDRAEHVNDFVSGLSNEDQDIFLNQVIDAIQKDRTHHLQVLSRERQELMSRLEEIDNKISDLNQRTEQLDMRRRASGCDANKCDSIDQESGFAVGKKVKIKDRIHGHKFKIGEVVEIVDYDHQSTATMWLCSNGEGERWWVDEDEATVV